MKKAQAIVKLEKRPEVKTGDTVVVHTIIRDGDKKRIQKFQGIIISTKGSGNDKTFTVRKISYGVGVEKVFPLYSTNIEKIEILKHASVRRSKLYYMRDRIGKAAMKLKPGAPVVYEENTDKVVKEDDIEVVETPADEVAEVEAVSETSNETAEIKASEDSSETPKEKEDNGPK